MVEAYPVAQPDGTWRKQIPGDLLAQAWHALPWGMLVVSAQGRITFYNQTYAQLRGLAPGALLGHPVERLDRRHCLRELFCTGTMPPEQVVRNEQRQNWEIIFPLWDESRSLTGAVVLVLRPGEWLRALSGSSFAAASRARMATSILRHGAEPSAGVGSPTAPESLSVLGVGLSGLNRTLFASPIKAASPLQRPASPSRGPCRRQA